MSDPTLDVPPYLVPRPPMPQDANTLAAFDKLYQAAIGSGGALLEYRLDAPLWQFLCHIADTRDVVLHGSQNPNIAVFQPRKADDVAAFGDRRAVYAAGDGLWPMYYAVLDRGRYPPMTRINGAMRLDDNGHRSEPYYFFSISREALALKAFASGTVYLLPRRTFEQQDPIVSGGRRLWVPQWASLDPVEPLARLAVRPEDFPLLATIRGHDDKTVFDRARQNPDGFPWLEDEAQVT